MTQPLRDFLRDILVQGAAIREDFKNERELIPGFKDRVEAAADERFIEFQQLYGGQSDARALPDQQNLP